jgi:hypothetical protein
MLWEQLLAPVVAARLASAGDAHLRADRVGSIEAEDRDERLVDGPHLAGCELSDASPEPLRVDGTDLFDRAPESCLPQPKPRAETKPDERFVTVRDR